ncbi:unnamed protein product [Sphagnum tenellum]
MCTGESSSRIVNKKGVQFGRKRGRVVPRAFPVLARWKRDVAATGADGPREKRERDDVKESRKEERRRRRVVGAGGRWLASATYLVTAKRPALLICGLWTERNNNPTWRVTIGTLDPGRPY